MKIVYSRCEISERVILLFHNGRTVFIANWVQLKEDLVSSLLPE